MKNANKNGITELVFILDRSGSMSGLEKDTIGGFNSMIEKQKKQEGECYVSTVLFDNESEVIHDRVKLSEIKPEMKLADDLGMDNLDLFEVCIQLKGHIVFQSRENEFLDWVDLLMESLESGSDLLPGYEGMTVAQLEKKVDSGHPMYAAKVR